MKMEEKLDIMFLHGGDFKKNAEGIMIYSPDNKACLGDLDTNTLDVFYIRNYHKELGYNDIKQCWWHVPGKGLENGLRNVNSDKEIREMVNCARTNEGLIDIYFEHTVSVPEVLEGDNTVVYLDDHGGEGCNAGIDTDVSPPLTQTHALVVAPPIPKVVPNTSCKSSPKKNKTSPRQSQPNHAKTANPSKTTKPLKKTNSPKATKPTKPTKLTKPTKISQPTKPSQNTKSDKSNKQKLSKRPSISKRPCTRSAARGFSSKVFNNEVPFDVSSDSSDSEEDSMFKPGPDEGSSSDSEATGNDPKTGSRIRRNMTHAAVGKRNISPLGKGKEKILHEDDGLVEEVSDAEVDLGFVGCVHEGVEDGLDPGVDSDGTNSWHSEEMKTPPNSKDELEEGNESEEASPLFMEGARFGELHLEVGMKFGTKWEFREAVREYTIQEGRSIKIVKNDNIRCRAVCKVKECSWVAYASRDHEDTCWQIKTFNDDHTCPREDKNMAANRNWVCTKLVKKVRKYSNFRHCEATTYFKTRFDLTLNKNSISRASMDARSVVYEDEKEQYRMVRDYSMTLLKTNPGSTVQICTTPPTRW
ncbi:uncharacterized protein [Arachis hypogaea]|uniref:uncharacterized protein n=1 Tax=Arachis hypogaea TaxID=3818 RepID=UPI003B218FFF